MPVLRVLLGAHVRGRAAPAGRTGLIVAPNHQSWIDPVIVQLALYPQRITFLMTEVYFDLPVARHYFRAVGARPIRESGPSVGGLRAAREALAEGEIICLFPEGAITTSGRIGPARRGVARLARRSGAPVLPVGIRGAIHVCSKLQRVPRLARVEVHLGEPMPYDETPDRAGEERFTERLMRRVRTLSGEA